VTDDDQDAQSLRRTIFDLGALVLLLTLWMGLLYRFTGLPDLARLPAWPGWDAFTDLASSRTAPLDGVLQLAVVAQWIVAIGLAAWLSLSVVLELLLAAVEHGPARGSAWLRGARAVLRKASFPLVHQVVATLFALQLIARPPNLAFAQVAQPTTAQTVAATSTTQASDDDDHAPAPADAIWHTVQPGDTLWGLSERYYGNGAEFERIIEGNVGRPLGGGRTFSRAGVIKPGDVLEIPLPSVAIEERDGQRFYVVEAGDTLSGISARILGDRDRWPEIFTLNVGVARLGERGPVLTDPNIIWPELRLLLPADSSAVEPTAGDTPVDSAPVPTPAVPPMMAVAPDRQDHSQAAEETPVASVSPTVVATPAPMQPPVETAPPTQAPPPTIEPVEHAPTRTGNLPPAVAALGAAGLAAASLAAGRLVVYKKYKPSRKLDATESDVQIQDGFADVDPVENLARRVAGTSDPASAIASLWGQAYAAIFDEQLRPEQRNEVQGVTVAATRHGRSSTTLVLAAPVSARPHLVHNMRAAAERAFGSQVDTDGLVDQDGDVLVRVTWHPRRPVAGHLLELVGASGANCAWPAPCLVPAQVLYDRQHLGLNWHTLSNVLIASPTGQSGDIPLVALVAALASVRAPEDLGLVVVARPHTLPDEIGLLPHGLLDVVDPGEPEAVQHALEGVKLEIDRRRQARSLADAADIVVVLRELADLEAEAMASAAAIAATGPQHGVRLLAASERPVAELLGICPFVDRLGTRLVLQTATEEDSVALLGMDGAEYLGAGGHALLRFEGRTPYHGWAHRVSADRLARLAHMMGTRPSVVPVPAPKDQAPPAPPDAPDEPEAVVASQPLDAPAHEDAAPAQAAPIARPIISREPTLLEKLRSAPIRVRCFGAREVWCGDRLLELADPQLQLLLLLAVHTVTGIQAELLIDMLWDRLPANPARALRGRRFDLRTELHQLVPELGDADPVPARQFHGDKVITLDTSLVASDVHEFAELLRVAGTLEPAAAVEAYEAALALYRGDLLDSSTVPNYRWMYDVHPQVALGLRSDYRSSHKEARQHLAELLVAGPEDGLARADDLYSGLCAEDLENEHLWIALFRIHERTGSLLGLKSAVRRYRIARIELGTTDVTDIDKVPLPPNLERLVNDIRSRLGGGAVHPHAGGD
jgi:LysM repeat protein